MKKLTKITEEQANELVGEPWHNPGTPVCWAEYGDYTRCLESLNEMLEAHGLELLKIDAGLSDMPFILRKVSS